MPTEANATDQPTPTTLSGAYIIALVSGAWQQLVATLFEPSTLRVVAVTTSTRTVTAEETGTTFTNEGASGTVTLNLPAATVGLHYHGVVNAAQSLRFDPNGSEIMGHMTAGSSAGTAGQYTGSSTVGAAIHIKCIKAGYWEVVSAKGTWTLA